PGGALGTDPRAFARRRGLVVFVLVELGVDLGDDDPVVLGGSIDGDIPVDDVLVDLGGRPLKRIAESASSRAGPFEAVSRSDRDVGEGRAEVGAVRSRWVEPDSMGDRGQPAVDTPGRRPTAIAA